MLWTLRDIQEILADAIGASKHKAYVCNIMLSNLCLI